MTAAQIRWMAALSEAEFTKLVIDRARATGWKVSHFRPAKTTKGWRTPVEGDAGCPDLILARRGRVLLVELKKERGSVRPEQRQWLREAGEHGRLWYPADWKAICDELAATRPVVSESG